jgi:hypothetical protein
MSKTIRILSVLILFFAIYAKAQKKYEATLYFLDGSRKSGKLTEVMDRDSKLIFIENGSKKREKIKAKSLDKVEYINPENSDEPITVELRECVFYTSKTPQTEYCWIKKIHNGEVSAYITYGYDGGIRNAYHYTVTPSYLVNVFFQYKNEKPQLIYFHNSTWTPNKKKIIKRHVHNFFKDICPKLVSDFEEDKIDMKTNTGVLMEYYEKNCNSNQNTSKI